MIRYRTLNKSEFNCVFLAMDKVYQQALHVLQDEPRFQVVGVALDPTLQPRQILAVAGSIEDDARRQVDIRA